MRRNVFYGLMCQGGLLLLTLVSTRLVFKQQGPEVLGAIGFAVLATSLLIFLVDAGITPTVTREVAAHAALEPKYVRDLFETATFLGWCGFTISALAIWIFIPIAVENWVNLEILDLEQATNAIRTISTALLLALPRAVYGAYLSGHGRIDRWNLANLWANSIQQIGLVIILLQGANLGQIALWYAISAILGLLPFVAFSAQIGGVGTLIPKPSRYVLLRNKEFSSHLFMNSMTGYFANYADRWSVSHFLLIADFAYYNFVQGISSKLGLVLGAMASAGFADLSKRAETSSAMFNFRKIHELTMLVCIISSGAIFLFGIVLSEIIFGSDVATNLSTTIAILTCGQMLTGVLTIPYWLTIARKRPDISLKANVYSILIVLPVTVLTTWQFGINGAAFSLIVNSAWQWIYFFPRICRECMEGSAGDVYWVTLKISLAGALSYAASWAVVRKPGLAIPMFEMTMAYIIGTLLFFLYFWSQSTPATRSVLLRTLGDGLKLITVKK